MLILALIISITDTQQFWTWLLAAFGLIYGIPGIYYFYLIFSKKTDFDVKDRPSREAMLKVSVITLASTFVLSLFFTESEILQKILLAAIANSLIYMVMISVFKFELSVHVGSITVLIIFLVAYFSRIYAIIGVLPFILTALSRYELKKHSFSEIAGGAIFSGGISILILLL